MDKTNERALFLNRRVEFVITRLVRKGGTQAPSPAPAGTVLPAPAGTAPAGAAPAGAAPAGAAPAAPETGATPPVEQTEKVAPPAPAPAKEKP